MLGQPLGPLIRGSPPTLGQKIKGGLTAITLIIYFYELKSNIKNAMGGKNKLM